MQFVFDERKAGQAAAWLLRRHGRPMQSTKLVTLLYLADRQSLVDHGYTVTGDSLIATSSGPALCNILELVTCATCDLDTPWVKYIKRLGQHRVTYAAIDERGALSEYETDLLDGLYGRFGSWPESKLRAWTKELAEWSKPISGVTPIDPVVILRDAGFSDEAIDEVVGIVASIHWLHSVLDR